MSNDKRRAAALLTTTSALATAFLVACGPSSAGHDNSAAPEDSVSNDQGDAGSSEGLQPERTSGRVRHHDAGAPKDAGATTRDAGSATEAGDSEDAGTGTETGSGGGSTPDAGGGSPAPEAGGGGGGNASGLAIHVSGNHLVDGAGNPITLRGVDVSNTEFTCAQNWTTDPYGGAPLSSVATFQAIRGWNANIMRLPLNEDCWLNINGVEVGGSAYQSAIQAEVAAAHAAGLFVILDLHWTAPGTQRALSQNPEPDLDHSPAFWTSLATMFANDPGVIFDLFNEPYEWWGTDPDVWNAWLNGDTKTQYVTGGSPYQVTANWQSVGMQQLVNTVRATGAKQPILINGIGWANDASGWLAHAPVDPANQLVVGAHIYPGQPCADTTCWDSVFGPIAAQYPVLVGETGDDVTAPVTFLPGFLSYADAHGWNYLAWTWNPWQDPSDVLVTDWNGTPNAGEGATYKATLLSHAYEN
ncbi:MAG TPA: cellulase family glycosylhydrolase [Polyangiaceae bacterium]|jgi:hypothetical protein